MSIESLESWGKYCRHKTHTEKYHQYKYYYWQYFNSI